jgi:glucose-6-phosphate isomerase
MDRLSPKNFGALIALYEHKVFVQSVIWDINAFDQWAVEHGKTMASGLIDEFSRGVVGKHDPSTRRLTELFLNRANMSGQSKK